MRTIDRATAFKRDYKREAKGRHRATLDNDLKAVFVALVTEQRLDLEWRAHELSGDWAAVGRWDERKSSRLASLLQPDRAGVGFVGAVGFCWFGKSPLARQLPYA